MKKIQIAAVCFAVLGLASCKNEDKKDTLEDASTMEVVKETETSKETEVIKEKGVYEASKKISFVSLLQDLPFPQLGIQCLHFQQ